MRIAVLAIVILAVASTSLRAQSNSPSADAGQGSSDSSDSNKLVGCLRVSEYHYLLTDEVGTVHLLAGAEKKLTHEVGHQIEVTGKPGIVTEDHTLAGGPSNVVEKPVFRVKTVKQVADTCPP